jgi:hypothetical protein
MIDREQMMAMLLGASPSFQAAWDEHVQENGRDLYYLALGEFARHLLRLYKTGRTEDFPVVAEVIERLHADGTQSTREAINSVGVTILFVMTLLPFVIIGVCFKRIRAGITCGIVAFVASLLYCALAS